MKAKALSVAALAAVVASAGATPTLAQGYYAADAACHDQTQHNGTAGAVLGGLAGALVGSSLASHDGGQAGGAVVGALAGALLGNGLGRASAKNSAPCQARDYGPVVYHGQPPAYGGGQYWRSGYRPAPYDGYGRDVRYDQYDHGDGYDRGDAYDHDRPRPYDPYGY
jgi:predicted lipid-binding transport protein (Tim44 family)